VLKAAGATADLFNRYYEWSRDEDTAAGAERLTGEAVPGEPTKYRFSREQKGFAKLTVKFKLNGVVKKKLKMNVWVVWVDMVPKTAGASIFDGTPLGNQNVDYVDGYKAITGIEYTGTVFPTAICLPGERPAIEDQKRVAPPGDNGGVPGPGNADTSGSTFKGWDMSRRRTTRVLVGPDPLSYTTPTTEPAWQRPVDYPPADSPVEGNDDTSVQDFEDSNPYDAEIGQIGEMVARDRPFSELPDGLNHAGTPPGFQGDALYTYSWFRDFSRVQIGKKWYRSSDYMPWRFYSYLFYDQGRWHALPNLFDLNNNDLPAGL
jgi:hypothetical protein